MARRFAALLGACGLMAAACGSSDKAPSINGAGAKAGSSYDKIITAAPVASSSDVDAVAMRLPFRLAAR